MNNLLTVGINILEVKQEGASYSEKVTEAYSDILRNTQQELVLASDKLGNGLYTLNGKQWFNIVMPSYSFGYCGNNKFCLLDGSNIHISSFPFNWITSTFTLEIGDSWETICYGSAGFIAVSSLGVTAKSLDGVTWTLGSIPLFDSSLHISEFTKGIYLILSEDLTFSFTSIDGVSWVKNSLSFTDTSTNKICIKNNSFFIIGRYDSNFFYNIDNKLYTSLDGITWEIVTNLEENDEFQRYIYLDFILLEGSFTYLYSVKRGYQPIKYYINSLLLPGEYVKLVEGYPSDFWTNFINTTEGFV